MHRFYPYALTIFALLGSQTTTANSISAMDIDLSRSESPYFQVDSSNSEVDSLPLKDTHVDVRIVGTIADVTVTQRYANEGSSPIEARYIFPGSTQAAVYAMNVQVGERRINAEIREKQQARQEYEEAKSAGNAAALLEQARANVFQMNVANILPGDNITVEMHYTELIVPTKGKYEFVFPTVVGPRYAKHTPATDQTPWKTTPYVNSEVSSPSQFSLQLSLVAPTAINNITSPSHALDVHKGNNDEFNIAISQKSGIANNRDFILNYQLTGARIASGAVLSKGDKENFFLAMVQPPKQVELQNIVPREYIFIVDISGSMAGFPLDTAKHLMKKLIGNLRETDTFNIMLFAGSNIMLSPVSLPATEDNLENALVSRNYGNSKTIAIKNRAPSAS